MTNSPTRILFILLVLSGAGVLAAETWTKDQLVAHALEHAPSAVQAKTSLQDAKDQVFVSLPLWQSSASVSAQAASAPNGLATGGSVSTSLKVLEQVGVDLSYGLSQGVKASVSLRPFTNADAQSAAVQALTLEEQRFANTTKTLTKAILSAYSQWVRAGNALALAELDRQQKQDTLDTEQIRFEAGKSSDSVLSAARLSLLDSDRALWSQRLTEQSARDSLLIAAGLVDPATFLDQKLAPPLLADPQAMLARAKEVLAARTPLPESLELFSAKLQLAQAQKAVRGWPSVLSGTSASASASLDGNNASWSVSMGYNLSFATLVNPQEKTLAKAVTTAASTLATATIKAFSESQLALGNLQAAVAQLELSQKQVTPAQTALDAQTIRTGAGAGTPQKTRELEISLLRAQTAVVSAAADLEAQLLNWQD